MLIAGEMWLALLCECGVALAAGVRPGEGARRPRPPLPFVVLNNGGSGRGMPEDLPAGSPLPAMALGADYHYERVIEAFGGKGFYVERPEELKPALQAAMDSDMPSIVNVVIHPRAGRKPQEFSWLTT